MNSPLVPIFLVDDLRDFRDPALREVVPVARTSEQALQYLRLHAFDTFGQIWLDHDLGETSEGTDDTTRPVVTWLCARALEGRAVQVEQVVVHTSNPVGAEWIVTSLRHAGYAAVRVNASEHLVATAEGQR